MSEQFSSSELLSVFLDGELEGDDVSRLFYQLASDVDLQCEMRHHIAIRNALRSEPMRPPADMKRKVLEATGLVVDPAATAGDDRKKGGGWKTTLTMIAVALLSSSVTLLVSNTFRDAEPAATVKVDGATHGDAAIGSPISSNDPAGIDAAVRREPGGASAEGGPHDLVAAVPPPRSSTGREVARGARGGRSNRLSLGVDRTGRPVVESPPALMPTPDPSGAETTASGDSSFMEAPRLEAIDLRELGPDVGRDTVPGALPHALLAASTDDLSSNPSNMSLGLRGFTARSFPATGLEPLAGSGLREFGVTFLYHLSEEHAFGVEMGRESIDQRYTRIEPPPDLLKPGEAGTDRVEVEQNYVALWVTGVYQFSPTGIGYAGVRPFMRGAAGGSAVGPVGRGTVGLRMEIGPVGCSAGLEGSLFLSRYGEEMVVTRKLGFTYGLSVKF